MASHFMGKEVLWMCLEAFSFYSCSFAGAAPPPPSFEHQDSCIDSGTISAADSYFSVHWALFDLACNYSVNFAFMLCQIHIAGCYALSSHAADSWA